MKIFHCDHCQNLVFFENTLCMKCGHSLAYLPDQGEMASLEAVGKELWTPGTSGLKGTTYRLCRNYYSEKICNWAVPEDDPHPLCRSCRLTRVIPDLNQPNHREAWEKLEVAKRRLVYEILRFHLPLTSKEDDPGQGLAFEFRADAEIDGQERMPVLTGHDHGVITINIAEADDGERESRKKQFGERYRTLLGHFRHEIGHYYWDRLIKGSDRLADYRAFFGDERMDYGQALQKYYQNGPLQNWQQCYISAYASSHPWEDWAESWAHFLHMTDTLETAEECGLNMKPRRADEPALQPTPVRVDGSADSFKRMIDAWFPLTYVLNNLNRGLGLHDGYPFILPASALVKLALIHKIVGRTNVQPSARQAAITCAA